jgi:hypothetical protein
MHDTRADLVAALSTVAGFTAYPYPPAPVVAGAAWPSLVTIEPYSLSWRYTYHCLLALPGTTLADAEAYADAHADAVLEALTGAGEVATAEPVLLAADSAGNGMPALRIRVTVL